MKGAGKGIHDSLEVLSTSAKSFYLLVEVEAQHAEFPKMSLHENTCWAVSLRQQEVLD